MEIGTAETINGRKRKLKNKSDLTGKLGSSGGNGRNSGGGGSDGGNNNFPRNDFSEDSEQRSSHKLRVMMWFFLLVVMMTFGVLMGAYVVIATNDELEWNPVDLPKSIWVSTILILASSVTYKIFQSNLFAEFQKKAKNWLLATTVLGAAFISSQILAWLALVGRGVYVQSNPYAGFFYILTAVHVVHVAGGIIVLGYIVLRTWQETSSDVELERRKNIARTVGWYWHFMDALWLVLLSMLVLYK
jgi:cytochrome c oxidase subunit 3